MVDNAKLNLKRVIVLMSSLPVPHSCTKAKQADISFELGLRCPHALLMKGQNDKKRQKQKKNKTEHKGKGIIKMTE